MKIVFHKYQGTGNDFIMIDNRFHKITLNAEVIKQLCDRRFGIGADGIILIEENPDSDFEMNYYNADGSQSFCGNGSRCVVKFAQSLGIVRDKANYKAIDGIHDSIINDLEVATFMNPVKSVSQFKQDYFIHTGSPHYIQFLENIDDIDLIESAHQIRYSDQYKEEGTNVNLVEIRDQELYVRTYERGVEDETYSCGTGVTAVAIAYAHLKSLKGKQLVHIRTKGGELKISFTEANGQYDQIQLIGPATKVYEGEIEI